MQQTMQHNRISELKYVDLAWEHQKTSQRELAVELAEYVRGKIPQSTGKLRRKLVSLLRALDEGRAELELTEKTRSRIDRSILTCNDMWL